MSGRADRPGRVARLGKAGTRRRETWLLLGSTLAALLVLELAVRSARGLPLLSAENFIVRRTALLALQRANVHDPLLGWVYRDHQSGNDFTIGERGVRMNSPGERPLARGAVLACGDSFTVGEEVADHQSWPARLEAQLGVPVINAGVGGYGADQIILRAESLVPDLRPRAVIVAFFMSEQLGDLGRVGLSNFSGANKPYFLIRAGQLIAGHSPVPPLSGRPAELGWLRSVLGRSALVDWVAGRSGNAIWWYSNRSVSHTGTDPAQVVDLLLRRLKDLTDKQGSRLIVLLLYGGAEVARWSGEHELAGQVLENARAAGIETVSAWAAFKEVLAARGEAGLRELYVMHERGGSFGHLSPAGNELTARLLAQRLSEKPAAGLRVP